MTAVAATRGAAVLDAAHLSFAGLVRSEWIKLRTVRSTVWCYVLIIALTVGFGILPASTVQSDFGGSRLEAARQMTILTSTVAINFTQLIAVVLGVLVIAGEYRTGMIRSTLTAAPGRIGAYLAKALVLTVVTFVVSAAAIAVTAAATAPILAAKGMTRVLTRPDVLLPLLGGAVYLALMALLAFAFGAIVRNTAGGIACVVGLTLVLPIVLSIVVGVTTGQTWVQNIEALLPAAAGGRLYQYAPAGVTVHGQPGVIMLNAWGGLAVLVGWVVVLGGIGLTSLKRRDA